MFVFYYSSILYSTKRHSRVRFNWININHNMIHWINFTFFIIKWKKFICWYELVYVIIKLSKTRKEEEYIDGKNVVVKLTFRSLTVSLNYRISNFIFCTEWAWEKKIVCWENIFSMLGIFLCWEYFLHKIFFKKL